jgi:hypothetical protein
VTLLKVLKVSKKEWRQMLLTISEPKNISEENKDSDKKD